MDDKIISMDGRESMAQNRREQETKWNVLIHRLTDEYPHICQNPRCKKKVMFGWLYSRAKEQGISLEEFIQMWTNPSHERNETIRYLCYPCYAKKERKERASKDARYKQLLIQSSIEILFHKLIEYKHRSILLRNDDNIKGQIWYENLIIYTFLKIYKIRQKITHPEFLKNINFTIKWGIRKFTEIDFIDLRITTLYFKMKWSIWKIKRYYNKRYRKLSNNHKKKNPKPTFKRIKEDIKKDKRFEKN